MKYAYYPGCSGETTSWEYNQSALAVCRELGIELTELPDWNCCGASAAHSSNYKLSHLLTARNLAIAEKAGMDTAVICPSCYLRLRDTQHHVKNDTAEKEKISRMIEMPYDGKFEINHLLEIITSKIGLGTVKQHIKKPLSGLRVVAYYGCYLVRPRELTGFDDPENPTTMDAILQAIGAEVHDWRGKVECCGGAKSLTDRNAVKKLVNDIVSAAFEVNADAIVTACGLCQANLESRQSLKAQIPILYFTELMGMSFGLDIKQWFNRHLINPESTLNKYSLQS